MRSSSWDDHPGRLSLRPLTNMLSRHSLVLIVALTAGEGLHAGRAAAQCAAPPEINCQCVRCDDPLAGAVGWWHDRRLTTDVAEEIEPDIDVSNVMFTAVAVTWAQRASSTDPWQIELALSKDGTCTWSVQTLPTGAGSSPRQPKVMSRE